jgi:rsbT co-antagonist protein RsbR
MLNSLSVDPSLGRFFELSGQPLSIMTAGGRLLKVNAAWSKLLGGSGPNGAAADLANLLHETDRGPALTAFGRLFPGPSEIAFESRAVCADGAVRRLSFRAATGADAGHVYGAVDHVAQADASASSSMRAVTDDCYEQILDALDDMVLVKGPRSRLLWANKAFRDCYGMTNEQLRGIIDAPFSEPDHTLQYIRDDTHVFETRETLDIPEEPVNRHDGGVRSVHTVKRPLQGRGGDVVGTFGVSRDITEERIKERGIRLLERAIGASSEGILVADATKPGHPVVYANASCERLLGAGPSEVLNSPIEQWILGAADPATASRLLSAIAEGLETSVECQRPGKGSAARFIRAALTSVRDDRGEVVSFIVVQTDITAERQRAAQEAAIEEQKSLIERQQKAIVDMSTPIIEIWEGVLTMPLIGVLDSSRAAAMMESLLRAVSASGARFSVIDLTGVEVVDTMTANHLLKLVHAVSLLGSTCMLSGISPAICMTMVTLGVELGQLRTFSTLRSALGFALGELGVTVGRRAR